MPRKRANERSTGDTSLNLCWVNWAGLRACCRPGKQEGGQHVAVTGLATGQQLLSTRSGRQETLRGGRELTSSNQSERNALAPLPGTNRASHLTAHPGKEASSSPFQTQGAPGLQPNLHFGRLAGKEPGLPGPRHSAQLLELGLGGGEDPAQWLRWLIFPLQAPGSHTGSSSCPGRGKSFLFVLLSVDLPPR